MKVERVLYFHSIQFFIVHCMRHLHKLYISSRQRKIDNRVIIKLKRDSVEPRLTATLIKPSPRYFGHFFPAKRSYIFLQKTLVNAVTHECGSPPHFKIISGKFFFTNFTPLTRPFVWNLQNWNACDIHFNVIDGVSWICSCFLFGRQYRPWFVKCDPAPEIDRHFFFRGAHWRLH